MKTINHSDLVAVLANINAAAIVALTTTTNLNKKMNKRGNPLVNEVVTKLSERKNYQFGYSYENGVNNRLDAQGCEANFKAEPLAWGEWLIPNKVIIHKGKLYGRFYRMANSIEENTYYVNGEKATAEQVATIKAFMPKSNGSNRQSEAGLTEHQVEPMAIEFASIDEIRVNGETYKVSHNEAEIEAA